MDGIMNEIATNEALQSEEADALSAIFENDWMLEDLSNKVYSITIQNSSKQSVYLQVTFPLTYPLSAPPTYLISAPWLNREAKHYLSIAMDEVYSQNIGTSIVFLWIETIKDFIEDTVKQFKNVKTDSPELFTTQDVDIDVNANADETIEDGTMMGRSDFNSKLKDPSNTASSQSLPMTLVIEHGETIIDRKSVFQAHVSKVSSVEQIEDILIKLKENRKIASASHNVMAYRITRGNVILHGFDDDGESRAGSCLLHLLEILDAIDLVVVVSRWFGGCYLGSDRFKHYSNAARSLLVREGLVKQKTTTETRKSRR